VSIIDFAGTAMIVHDIRCYAAAEGLG